MNVKANKTCIKCGSSDIDFYARRRYGKIHISNVCILCQRDIWKDDNHKRDKEKVRFANKKWQKENREKFLESLRKSYYKRVQRGYIEYSYNRDNGFGR